MQLHDSLSDVLVTSSISLGSPHNDVILLCARWSFNKVGICKREEGIKTISLSSAQSFCNLNEQNNKCFSFFQFYRVEEIKSDVQHLHLIRCQHINWEREPPSHQLESISSQHTTLHGPRNLSKNFSSFEKCQFKANLLMF